ncbi:hypothetical protein QDT91_00840 [Mycolicibacterium aubagnense]|uniref:hypothetical protein n=1 Tax=Mycolicibacterium aubagnense TaxID=319707 RepID=UPI0012782932|nr:hypothetical protein [Mycolicibacterium aubagnense]TLH49599.1 hypothetical protein C1S80_28230 [Mycolicibacterium aubagnense]WGI32980.1 hypothetical protein QDT91_00840 [Mycolicibacterium aubagnense]
MPEDFVFGLVSVSLAVISVSADFLSALPVVDDPFASEPAAALFVFLLLLESLCVGEALACVEESESADGAALATAAPPSSAALTPKTATPLPSQVDTANVRRSGRRCLPAISVPPTSCRTVVRPRQIKPLLPN